MAEDDLVPPGNPGEASAGRPHVPKPERSRPRRPRTADPKPLGRTEGADRTTEHLEQTLRRMLFDAAKTEAERRRATAIDTPDYEAGFDRIVNPSRRSTFNAIVADLATTGGGLLIGVGTTLYFNAPPNPIGASLSMLGGAALTLVGVALKYGPYSR